MKLKMGDFAHTTVTVSVSKPNGDPSTPPPSRREHLGVPLAELKAARQHLHGIALEDVRITFDPATVAALPVETLIRIRDTVLAGLANVG